jgi:hypothetical protein
MIGWILDRALDLMVTVLEATGQPDPWHIGPLVFDESDMP